MQSIKNVLINYKLTILAVILILVLILMPASDIPSVGIPGIDKLVHCGMFGFLSLCYYGEYYYKHKNKPRALYVMGSVAIYAALTEFMQLYVPGRACDFMDWIADCTGIILATICFGALIKWLKERK